MAEDMRKFQSASRGGTAASTAFIRIRRRGGRCYAANRQRSRKQGQEQGQESKPRIKAKSRGVPPMNHADDQVDVLIAGGGFAGLTLAVALRQGLGPSVSVTVADPMLGRSHDNDERASAIVAAARRLFETLGVWEDVADGAQPILDMIVTDSRIDDVVRPTFLTFGGEVEPGEPFAHMVENRFLIAALEAKAKAAGVQLRKAAVSDFSPPPERGRWASQASRVGVPGSAAQVDPSPDRLRQSDPR